MGQRLLVAVAILAITLLGFFLFPGHTYLQSDTQIYLPILERQWDPSVLTRDEIAMRPHVSYTAYDEVALGLRRLTHLSFRTVLAGQQIVFRAAGVLGVFLLATSAGLAATPALVVAAVFALGADIGGPAVLTVEYEPVPRGVAIPLVMLALGLIGHGKLRWAGLAAGVGFLYHPPSVWSFGVALAAYVVYARDRARTEALIGLSILASAGVLLGAMALLQPPLAEAPALFGQVGPELERLQRLRAGYNWVSQWPATWIQQYTLWLPALCGLALWRLWRTLPAGLRFFLVALPLLGLVSIPLSYLLLEKAKWALMPQFQPARAVLFLTAGLIVMATLAGVRAAQVGRWWEAIPWLAVALSLPANRQLAALLADALARRRALLALGLAVAFTLAVRLWATRPAAGRYACALAVPLPMLLLPTVGEVQNYRPLWTQELVDLAAWARASTPKEAVFLFPEANRDLHPGVFRAEALRALYVDWKAGGQANFLPGYADEWWRRWQDTMAPPPKPVAAYAPLGVSFVVLPVCRHGMEGVAYRNGRYCVYRTNTQTPAHPPA